MAKLTKAEMLKIVDDNIARLKNNDFKLYFFVLDTKGNPSSSLEYIYRTAMTLKNMGYNVVMLHQEKEFVGVGDWLGKEFAELPHANIEKDNVETTPSDFLFIPEIFANVISQTKKLPCKRVVIVQNYNHITEFLPVSLTYDTLGITDVITTTKRQEEKVREYFPTVRTHIVSPSIPKVFRGNDEPRKLVVNVISKEQSDINMIIKPFYWKYPLYKWVTFRDLRGLSQEAFAESLRQGAITVWVDDKTNFGYSLLEALKCGSLVLAKTPDHPSDWMLKDDTFNPGAIWFNDLDDVPEMLASVVRSWTIDKVPSQIYGEEKKFTNIFTEEIQKTEIEQVYVKELIEKRLKDFEETKVDVENNVLKGE